jgi:hypothetical protein
LPPFTIFESYMSMITVYPARNPAFDLTAIVTLQGAAGADPVDAAGHSITFWFPSLLTRAESRPKAGKTDAVLSGPLSRRALASALPR